MPYIGKKVGNVGSFCRVDFKKRHYAGEAKIRQSSYLRKMKLNKISMPLTIGDNYAVSNPLNSLFLCYVLIFFRTRKLVFVIN